MIKPRFLLPTLLLACFSCPASAADVPAALVGEWFSGPQHAASVYTTDFGGANGDARRLLFNKDGTYVFTEFESTQVLQGFAMSAYQITCEMMTVRVEHGTFSVSGGQVTFRSAKVDKKVGYSPARLNNGCKRHTSDVSSKADAEVSSVTWSVAQDKLTLKSGNDSASYARRTPPPAPPTDITSFLRGEWHNGTVSPIEYYNTATGKWAEASGTSTILKFGPNFTYERTGLLVVTTYGCTSKLLVQEKGRVSESNNELTFTPTTSSATGYTCTPGNVSTAKDHIKPYGASWRVRVETNGQHTLIFSSDGHELSFNRPPGTPPETTRAPATSTTSSTPTTPTTPSAPAIPAAPAKWTATGAWDAVITVNDQTYRVQVKLQDDSPRILGYGDDPVEYANGNSETGALDVGLDVDGLTMSLKVQGRFEGDRYTGQVRWTNYEGDDLGRGTITMTRR